MPPAAILFDLDGVLVDSYRAWHQLTRAAARYFGAPDVTAERFAEGWGQGVEDDVRTLFPSVTVEALAAFYDRCFPDHLGHVRFDPAGRKVLEALRERGSATALVTNTPTPLARSILAAGGLRLDAVVGAADGLPSKPAPDMLLHACALVGAEPDTAWMVGDSHYDREAARSASVRFAGLRTHGDVRLESLDEVLGLQADDSRSSR